MKLVDIAMGPKKPTPRQAPVTTFDAIPFKLEVTPFHELTTEEHVTRIIEEFDIYGRGIRDRLIAHIKAAELRGTKCASTVG